MKKKKKTENKNGLCVLIKHLIKRGKKVSH